MEADVNPSVVCPILILMAAASLFAMISLNQVNLIVHTDLYSFGLQFSYTWAIPYWLFSGIVFGLSWLNIAIAIIVTLYIFKKRQKQLWASENSKQVYTSQARERGEQRSISEYAQHQEDGLPVPREERGDPLSEQTIDEEIIQPEEPIAMVETHGTASRSEHATMSEPARSAEEAHFPPENIEKRRSDS